LENALPLLRDGRQVYFMFLPEGEDPDTFVRTKGKDIFLDPGMRSPLSDFLFNSLLKGVDLDTPEGRALMMEKSLPHLFKLPTGALQNILIQELGKLTHYDTDLIKAELLSRTGKDNGKPVFKRPVNKDQGVDKIRWLVRCLLHQPTLANDVETTENLAVFTSPGIIFLTELIEFIKARPNISLGVILENWRDSKFEQRLSELAAEEEFFNEIGVTVDEFLDTINRLIKANIQQFDSFKLKSKPSDLTEDEKIYYRNLHQSVPDST
jgi:DNA primase